MKLTSEEFSSVIKNNTFLSEKALKVVALNTLKFPENHGN